MDSANLKGVLGHFVSFRQQWEMYTTKYRLHATGKTDDTSEPRQKHLMAALELLAETNRPVPVKPWLAS